MSVMDLVPEPSRTAGFSFGRAPVSRNASFGAGSKRSRSNPVAYNRSITTDLSDLSDLSGAPSRHHVGVDHRPHSAASNRRLSASSLR